MGPEFPNEYLELVMKSKQNPRPQIRQIGRELFELVDSGPHAETLFCFVQKS